MSDVAKLQLAIWLASRSKPAPPLGPRAPPRSAANSSPRVCNSAKPAQRDVFPTLGPWSNSTTQASLRSRSLTATRSPSQRSATRSPAPASPTQPDDLLQSLYVNPALQTGLTSAAIRRTLERNSIPIRKPTPVLNRAMLEEALAAGDTTTEIAQRHGTTVSIVRRALHREELQTATQRARQDSHARINLAIAHLDTRPTT